MLSCASASTGSRTHADGRRPKLSHDRVPAAVGCGCAAHRLDHQQTQDVSDTATSSRKGWRGGSPAIIKSSSASLLALQ